MNIRPVSFPQWKVALAQASFSPQCKAAFTREILTFLRYCKSNRTPATTELAREYLAWREPQTNEPSREALRWFYREGSKQMKLAQRADTPPQSSGPKPTLPPQASFPPSPYQTRRAVTPPPAASDLGATTWEQALIKASRERGFLWRTEQTYREWAVRFARFIAPRSPEATNGEDVAAFLSALAVEGRSSPSTQKQALNALVFLMQAALGRPLGEMDFARAYPKKRLPTVLSANESRSLFAQMEGTPRLMAELAYGSGLRLMELLRLRVHHLDLDRLSLHVFSGKGDKDRVTVMPETLVPELRELLARLRKLWEADRAANTPGVWLPEGLARKYPNAGLNWEWQWLFPSRELALDPATGIKRRHHVSDSLFQRAMKLGAQKAGMTKRVSPHTLRHSFGTHLLESGTDIRTVQELMGHESLETTQIYLHVMKKPGLGVRSPLDGLDRPESKA